MSSTPPSTTPPATPAAHLDYILHLADNALVHGQRLAEWCGHGPLLEEDIAMANIGLDHIGQARMLYQHAAQLMGQTSEDQLAYFRNPEQFLNYTLLELPHRTALAPSATAQRDYAVTIARNFLYASLMLLVWTELQQSSDSHLAAIAGKSVKEVRYHLRHSTDWMLRLGDGTTASHQRMQAAFDYVMPYTQEWFTPSVMESTVLAQGVGVDTTRLEAAWRASVSTVAAQASLHMPASQGYTTRGKQGLHSEHLSYLLAEMQSLARAHPKATW
jgi:ring-1,2-phenylacetyl-CoA epoxidase subunit PaaC